MLTTVVDCDGRTNTLTYTSGNLLSVVSNAYGQSAHFYYDANKNLTNLVDAAGMSSTLTYNSSNNPTALITPYGSNQFTLVDNGISYYGGTLGNAGGDANGLIDRSALVVDPTDATNLYIYRYDSALVLTATNFNNVPTNTPLGTLDDGTGSTDDHLNSVYFRNSFYWGPKQYAQLSTGSVSNFVYGDYLLARTQHWLQDTNDLYLTGLLSVERDPSPDGGQTEGLKTFYDYQGKTYNYREGTNALPSVMAWQLPNGETHYDYLKFDYFGNITNWISTFTLPSGTLGTRTNRFIYANNTYVNFEGGLQSGTLVLVSSNTFAVPDLLTQIIGPDGTNVWAYGSFDSVTWTNYFYASSGTSVVLLASARILPDYATNGVGQVAVSTYSSPTPITIYDPSSPTVPVYGGFTGYNKITSAKSVTGLTTTNIYNGSGFLAQTIDLEIARTNSFSYTTDGLIGTFTNELGLNVSATWDNLLRLTSVQFPDTTYISNIYNRLDLGATKDRLGNWTTYGYDGARHLTVITNANNAVTLLSWCGCGALTGILDPLNNATSFYYDSQGNLTNVTFPDATTFTYQYDSAERVTNVFDGAGRSLRLGYDNQGLITTVSNAYGKVRSEAYDIRDRRAVVTDANGVTVTNTYDPLNRILTRTWADGIGEEFGYSPQGLAFYTNRDDQVTKFGRDAAGRLIAITNANNEVVQTVYDPAGDITNLVDGLNHTTTWQYNQFGWMTNKVDALTRNAFRFAYNANGWVTNRVTPQMGTAAYTYDNVGNLKSIIYPQLTNNYGYNLLNELTNMVDSVGTNVFSYTQVGQLASENGPWANDTVSYLYSQMLRTNLTLTQPSGTWAQGYSYDSAWRMTNTVSPAGAFSYVLGGTTAASSLIKQILLPNGASITNGYDALARLTQTALNNQWGHTLDGYTYVLDSLGLRTNIVRNLGLTASSVTVGYDKIGQITSWLAQETNGAARLNEELGFGFDAADNLKYRTNGVLAQTFTVDAANELTNVSRTGTFTLSGATPAPANSVTVNGQAAQTYGDFTFARTNLSLLDGNNSFTNIAQNAYGVLVTNVLTANLSVSDTLQYDQNGNLTNDGTRVFAYDTENELTNVSVAGQWESAFMYDGLGRRRIVRDYAWQSGTWTKTNEVHYIYDGYLPIQERDTNNNVLVTYTRGLDLSGDLWDAGGIGGLLARTDTNGSTFYHADGAGNITALMDTNENIVARYLYNPFGKLIGEWGSLASANEMQFSSMPQHDGLSLYPFRGYEPNLQRFLNHDPIQEAGGLNLYAFAANNPVYWIDPFGLSPDGHHLIPKQIWKNLSDRVKKVWDEDPKNRLDSKNYKDHNGKNYGPKGGNKVRCKDYNKAVNDKLNKFLEDKGAKSAEDLSDQELQDFADEIKNTTDGPIGDYNAGVAEEIAEAEAAAAEGAEAAEVAEALTVAVEVDEAVVATGAIIK